MAVNNVVTSDEIRRFMMDRPELNTLVDGVRWDEKDVEQAMITCCDIYNSTTPIMLMDQYRVENFPYRYIMTIFCAGHLLRSAAINQASNQLTYSADGVTVDDNNKAQLFGAMSQELLGEAKDMMKQIKISKNVMGAYGGKASEYAYLIR